MVTERLNDVWLVGTTWWQGCGELLLQDNCFCKAMAVSQALIFHFKCYSILHFAVCQLLCWAFLLSTKLSWKCSWFFLISDWDLTLLTYQMSYICQQIKSWQGKLLIEKCWAENNSKISFVNIHVWKYDTSISRCLLRGYRHGFKSWNDIQWNFVKNTGSRISFWYVVKQMLYWI